MRYTPQHYGSNVLKTVGISVKIGFLEFWGHLSQIISYIPFWGRISEIFEFSTKFHFSDFLLAF